MMGRLRELLKGRARWLVLFAIVAAAGYLALQRGKGPTRPPAAERPPVAQPVPPGAPPATQPRPAPAAPAPAPAPRVPAPSVVPSGPTGRADPFVPLVRSPGATLPPPGVELPPPPFPVPPGPGPGPGPTPSPVEGIAVTGIVGDTGAVAVIAFGSRTEIVAPGETVGDLRILRIDARRRIVTFLRGGKRFDVRMGGG